MYVSTDYWCLKDTQSLFQLISHISPSPQNNGVAKGVEIFQKSIYISQTNPGTCFSSLPFVNQLHKNGALLQSSLKYLVEKMIYGGHGRKTSIWPITLSPILAGTDLLQSFLSGVFSECEDTINVEKILYFIFKPTPFFKKN